MKGAVGFLVGLIGFCFFAAVSIIIPMTIRRGDGIALFLFMIVVAFVFLNVMIVGFYRLLLQLHETVLFPDDPFHFPQRGRVLFFVGYIGLLVTLGSVMAMIVLAEVVGIRMGREIESFLTLFWFVGWIFLGLFLGGIFAMVRDIYQKAQFHAHTRPREDRDETDDLDIRLRPARGESRRPRDAEYDDRPRRRGDPRGAEQDTMDERRPRRPWEDG